IRRIPKGKVRRIGVLRDKLARDDGVERTCPIAWSFPEKTAPSCSEAMPPCTSCATSVVIGA
ncbi:MAG: hypothetical protein ACYSU1_05440, partial [Planctomycetota bacterium]